MASAKLKEIKMRQLITTFLLILASIAIIWAFLLGWALIFIFIENTMLRMGLVAITLAAMGSLLAYSFENH